MFVNLDAVEKAETIRFPYPHFMVPDFLSEERLSAAIRDFPELDMPGLFLPDSLTYGPLFSKLLRDLESDELREIVGGKLGVDLAGRPTLVTVRGHCAPQDGKIHSDSHFKLVTLLLYLNEPWAEQGGRLRVLRSGTDIEDYAGEVPPSGGTLFGFRVQENSWHGHKPFVGPRSYVMVNYCRDIESRDREAARHRLSGRVKKFKRLFGGAALHERPV